MLREATKLVLGRGQVYFDRFPDGASVGDGELYFGNTPSFQLTREIERLERNTSYRGRKHQLPGAVISESVEIKMTTDHMASENVSLWFSSEPTPIYAGDEFIPYVETMTVRKGRFYQLGAQILPGGFRYVDIIAISMGATPLVNGVDYLLDQDHGRIQILPSGTIIGSSASITATYRKRPSVTSVLQSQATEVIGALRYIARDPYGPKVDYWFPRVRITPRGAIELKSDEFRQISFDVTALRLSPNHALLYAITDTVAPTPITADTTLVTADSTQYTADNGLWISE